MRERLIEIQKTNPKEQKEVEEIIGIPFPSGISAIIQGYLNDERPALDEKCVSLSGLSFFGDKVILFADRAAYYALYGLPDKFEEIVRHCPQVLSKQVERTGPSGNVRATPYQLLLREDDNHIRDEKGRTFLEMARAYFSENEAKEQEEKWFKGWDEKAHVDELKAVFNKVAEAFDESKAGTADALKKDDTLQAAIKNFKKDLKMLAAQTKKNCIPQLWDYSTQFYTSEKFEAYGGYNSHKNRLFCFQICGEIDINLSAWGLQVVDRGIYFGEDQVAVPRRDISSYYGFSSGSTLFLGYNSYLCVCRLDASLRDEYDSAYWEAKSSSKKAGRERRDLAVWAREAFFESFISLFRNPEEGIITDHKKTRIDH